MATAFVFPGQGSQQIGMLRDFADSPIVKKTFAECSAAINEDLWKLAAEGPAEKLNMTENTQPVLLTASIALYRLWTQAHPPPELAAGHSLGEYSALVAAGCLDLPDAVCLVRRRGQLMQQAVPPGVGAMAAVLGLEDAEVEACCRQAAETEGEVVAPANYNCPGQVVIAGAAVAVRAASELCDQQGARRIMPLPVSVPSHCTLMQQAADSLAVDLRAIQWRPPQFVLVQNVSAKSVSDPAQIVGNLELQLHQPVRWSDCVGTLVQMGADKVLECGPKQVLSGLMKKINKTVPVSHVEKELTGE